MKEEGIKKERALRKDLKMEYEAVEEEFLIEGLVYFQKRKERR